MRDEMEWKPLDDADHMFDEDVNSADNMVMVFHHPNGVPRQITKIEVEVWNGGNKATSETSCTISYPSVSHLTD